MNPKSPTAVIVVHELPSNSTQIRQLHLKPFHLIGGIIQMIIGILMFLVEIAAVCSFILFATGPGIYCGLLIFVSGLLSMLGSKLESRSLIIASMVLNIIAAVACGIGLSMAGVEIYLFQKHIFGEFPYIDDATVPFGFGKSIFMLICCLFEFIFTIVHATMICKIVCSCCMKNEAVVANMGPQKQVEYQTHIYPAPSMGYVLQNTVPVSPECVNFDEQHKQPLNDLSMPD